MEYLWSMYGESIEEKGKIGLFVGELRPTPTLPKGGRFYIKPVR